MVLYGPPREGAMIFGEPNMYDHKTSTFGWIAGILWGLVAVLITASWATDALSLDWVARDFGFTACAGSAVAATVNVRIFAARVCQHLKNAYELGRDTGRLEAVPTQRVPSR